MGLLGHLAVLTVVVAALCAPAARAQEADPHEKPSQLARPNGNSPVDPKQTGDAASADAATDAPATAATTSPNASGTQQQAQGTGPQTAGAASGDWLAPLRRFAGTFAVRPDSGPATTYENTCQTSGSRFLECELMEGGETAALLIFVPGQEPGSYFTQRVLPSGTATGRGDLKIDGDRWVFSSQHTRNDGAVDYTRLTLTFSGAPDAGDARFEAERSDDNSHWMRTNTGSEKRQK